MTFLPILAIASILLLQTRKRLQTALAFNAWVDLPLDAVHFVHALLQFFRSLASARLRPTFTRTLRPFNHTIVLWTPSGIPGHGHAQADQPQRQVGGPIARRSPGCAVVDAEAFRQAPPRKNQAQRLLHDRGFDQVPRVLGGKSWSARPHRCTHPRDAANLSVGRCPSAIGQPRPSAKHRADTERADRRLPDVGPEAPPPGRIAETSVARFVRWDRHRLPASAEKHESSRHPTWHAAAASPRPSGTWRVSVGVFLVAQRP